MKKLLMKLVAFDRVQKILDENPDISSLDFVKKSAEAFHLFQTIHDESLIEKPTLFYCTHHTGALDFLVTYPYLSSKVKNLKVVMNQKLLTLRPLADIAVGVNPLSSGLKNEDGLTEMRNHLKNNGSLLIFPAGKVATQKNGIVSDFSWRNGSLELIKTCDIDIVPVYVDAQMSPLFYQIRNLFPKLSLLFLLKNLCFHAHKTSPVYIGKKIPRTELLQLPDDEIIPYIRNKTYELKNINRSSL